MTDTSAPLSTGELQLMREALYHGAFSDGGIRPAFIGINRATMGKNDLATASAMSRDQIRGVLAQYHAAKVAKIQSGLAKEAAKTTALQNDLTSLQGIVVAPETTS
jgi:hypothetical protein